MPKNLTARANTLIKEWQERGLVHVTSDGKVAFDKSAHDAYETERSSKKSKTSESEYVSPYKDSMYSDAEKIILAQDWEFQSGDNERERERLTQVIDQIKQQIAQNEASIQDFSN